MGDSPVIPFETEAYEGFAECHGILYLKNSYLVMEFQTKDSFVGLIKSKVKKIQLPYGDIYDVNLLANVFRTKLSIFSNNLSSLEKFPGMKQGEISLKIKRRDKDNCQRFVSKLKLMVSEAKLDNIENE